MSLSVKFHITYRIENNATKNYDFDLPNATKVIGSCHKNIAFNLNFYDDWILFFLFTGNNSIYTIDQIMFTMSLKKNQLPIYSALTFSETYKMKVDKVSFSNYSSFCCKKNQIYIIPDIVKIEIRNFRFQAGNPRKIFTFSDDVVRCTDDIDVICGKNDPGALKEAAIATIVGLGLLGSIIFSIFFYLILKRKYKPADTN